MIIKSEDITSEKGVYVLFLMCTKKAEVRVGCIGRISLKEGIYAYVGSAYGGGGIRKRVSRHLRTNKKCRWHIDYIRRHMSFCGLWVTTAGSEMEHRIADMFLKSGATVPMKGFGASDCRCESHLFYMREVPEPPVGIAVV